MADCLHSRHDLSGLKRVSTQLEEIVLNPDLRQTQYGLPDDSEALLRWRVGCDKVC